MCSCVTAQCVKSKLALLAGPLGVCGEVLMAQGRTPCDTHPAVSRQTPRGALGRALVPVPVLAPAWVCRTQSSPLCLTGEAAAAPSDVQYQTANAHIRQNRCWAW